MKGFSNFVNQGTVNGIINNYVSQFGSTPPQSSPSLTNWFNIATQSSFAYNLKATTLAPTYGSTALYEYGGVAYKQDYIGNIAWGQMVSSLGVSLNTALNGSNLAQYIDNLTSFKLSGDDPRDSAAITQGFLRGASSGIDQSAADGGFVLYPNKSNTNMIRSVYAK